MALLKVQPYQESGPKIAVRGPPPLEPGAKSYRAEHRTQSRAAHGSLQGQPGPGVCGETESTASNDSTAHQYDISDNVERRTTALETGRIALLGQRGLDRRLDTIKLLPNRLLSSSTPRSTPHQLIGITVVWHSLSYSEQHLVLQTGTQHLRHTSLSLELVTCYTPRPLRFGKLEPISRRLRFTSIHFTHINSLFDPIFFCQTLLYFYRTRSNIHLNRGLPESPLSTLEEHILSAWISSLINHSTFPSLNNKAIMEMHHHI
jgi:hypothetical protein